MRTTELLHLVRESGWLQLCVIRFCFGVRLQETELARIRTGEGTMIEFVAANGEGVCAPGASNVVGAAWSSSHDPDDASDHLPGIYTNIATYAVNCPPATNLTYRLGFAHTDPVKTRNLVRIETGDPRDDDTDHCMGVVWSEGGTLDLKALLDPVCNPYLNSLSFWLNGKEDADGVLEYGDETNDLSPSIYHIGLHHPSSLLPQDRLWVVINARKSKAEFEIWMLANSNLTWTTFLPKPFSIFMRPVIPTGVQ